MHQNSGIPNGKITNLPSKSKASVQEERLQAAVDLYINKNYSAALPIFISLIDDNCEEAYGYVASIYETGGDGVVKDLEKAFFYFQKSIEEFANVGAYLALARFYYFGQGTKQNYDKAFEYYSWVEKEKNHPLADLMLGRMYQHGHSVQQDFDKAREYYRKAAQKGYVIGLTYLGLLEQQCGHYWKGWWLRLKAGAKSFKLAKQNPRDPRLRSC